MLNRTDARTLLETNVASASLRRHCEMVARAMAAYAETLGENVDQWFVAGLLHDLDWERWPGEHPRHAVDVLLPEAGIADPAVLDAIRAHAPDRTGKQPETMIGRYLFACDELCGFLDAAAKVRPGGYAGMQASSVKKKLKDKRFAANVSREDIARGAELIRRSLDEHCAFLIDVFQE